MALCTQYAMLNDKKRHAVLELVSRIQPPHYLLSRPSLFLGKELIASWYRRESSTAPNLTALASPCFSLRSPSCPSRIDNAFLTTAALSLQLWCCALPLPHHHPAAPESTTHRLFPPATTQLPRRRYSPPRRRSARSLATLSLSVSLRHARSTRAAQCDSAAG